MVRKLTTLAASLMMLLGLSLVLPSQAYAWSDVCAGDAGLLFYSDGNGELWVHNQCAHDNGFKMDVRVAVGSIGYCPDEYIWAFPHHTARLPYDHVNCYLHDVT